MKIYLLSFFTLLLTFSLLAQNDADGDAIQLDRGLPELPSPDFTEGELTTIPAGDAIEGDYIGEMKFTRDGSEVWVLNRTTNNITVIDWATQIIVQNIPVGAMPMDIDFSDDLAVVACYGSNQVYFIQLDNYNIAAVETVANQPAKVHVSKAGNVAVIGCDEPNVAEVFDLNTLVKTLTISDFEVYLYKFSFITSNPRNSVYYSNFRITDDENYLVNGADENALKFWDLTTGDLSDEVPEAGNSGQIELSVDGQTLIAMRAGNPGVVTQVDVASQSFMKQMELTDVSIYSTYSPPAVSADGNYVLVTTNPGNTALLDFSTETWQHVETGNPPDWVGRSTDGQHLIAGDYYIAVIDPESGSIESSLNGTSIQNGAVGAGNRIVASDPLRYESLVFYEFENPDDLNFIGGSTTGSDVEADATYSVKFSPNGKKLLAVNSLSGTLSFIDVETENLETIIQLGSSETFHVDITSDSRYALIAKRLVNKVAIVDMQTGIRVADVPSGGSKPDQVFVLPGDEYAYAINAGGGDNIGVIKLDGENSTLEETFAIGNTGISWTNYGIRSDLKFTPDGTQAVLANPFDEQVQIIDLADHEIVATVPVEGFPLQIAVAPSAEFGNFVGVTLKNSSKLAIIAGQGSDWSLVGTYPCATNPLRVEYDPFENNFWVVSADDGKTQAFDLDLLAFNGGGTSNIIEPIALLYAEVPRRFTLYRSSDTDQTAHRLKVTDLTFDPYVETYDLPALPIHHFDISSDGTLAAVAHPVTDEVSLLKETPLGFELFTISLQPQPYLLFPNPVTETIHFRLHEGAQPVANPDFRLFDLHGKLMFEKQLTGGEAFDVSRQAGWMSGQYFYELKNEGEVVQSGKVILK